MTARTGLGLLQVALLIGVVILGLRSARRARRREEIVQSLGRLQHDIACNGGHHPHIGHCAPKSGTPEQELARWVMLGQATALGIGRLPVAMLMQMERDK